MQWRGKEIVDLENHELADASCTLEAISVQNEKRRLEAAKNPRFKRNNKNTALGNRNPVFDQLLSDVRQEMKSRNFTS